MPDKINLKNISIVLHRTRSPENIGAAARAIRNMGIGQLVVVDPQPRAAVPPNGYSRPTL